jgi:hypothetical protein
MPQTRRAVPESSASRFVRPDHEGFLETGRTARRGACVLHMAEITHEDVEDSLIFSETGHVAGGPLATGRYIR